MNVRVLLAAAALVVAPLAVPAHASAPGCITFGVSYPAREDRHGPDVVYGTAAWVNYCGQGIGVATALETKYCDWVWGCTWLRMEESVAYMTTDHGRSGWVKSEAWCRNGEHRYRVAYLISAMDGSTWEGYSGDTELRCTDDVPPPPPPPSPECPKYGEPACYLIDPPNRRAAGAGV